jgi:surface polysaccharide O-acyltransferase-like enzyme
MAKKEKGLVFNHQTITIRGSFINMLFTMVLMVLFIVAAFKKEVADNLKMIAELIIAIYAISYGVWQGKKYLEGKKEKKDEPVE